ncbi:hypothetical protein OHB45_00530 [Streptomyces coelicoflavus]|nr:MULTISPECIES: hypothetical protein [Streptomyces]MCX5034782.1 hypothetical protein [Streptomyces coelicoflavus]
MGQRSTCPNRRAAGKRVRSSRIAIGTVMASANTVVRTAKSSVSGMIEPKQAWVNRWVWFERVKAPPAAYRGWLRTDW